MSLCYCVIFTTNMVSSLCFIFCVRFLKDVTCKAKPFMCANDETKCDGNYLQLLMLGVTVLTSVFQNIEFWKIALEVDIVGR